jgi:hypothetical protein
MACILLVLFLDREVVIDFLERATQGSDEIGQPEQVFHLDGRTWGDGVIGRLRRSHPDRHLILMAHPLTQLENIDRRRAFQST